MIKNYKEVTEKIVELSKVASENKQLVLVFVAQTDDEGIDVACGGTLIQEPGAEHIAKVLTMLKGFYADKATEAEGSSVIDLKTNKRADGPIN